MYPPWPTPAFSLHSVFLQQPTFSIPLAVAVNMGWYQRRHHRASLRCLLLSFRDGPPSICFVLGFNDFLRSQEKEHGRSLEAKVERVMEELLRTQRALKSAETLQVHHNQI